MTEIYLEKKSSTGAPLFWRGINKGNVNTYTFGQIGGKDPIPKIDTYTQGKNIGKANETTPAEQALFDLETTALKKIDAGYSLVEGEISEHKSHVKVSKDFKQPMKAHKWVEQSHKLPETMYAQPKLDGMRTNGSAEELLTIKGKPIVGVPHITAAIKELSGFMQANDILYLDGELYSHDLPFEKIISVCKQTKTLSNNYTDVSLFLFDVVTKKPMPFVDRLKLMDKIKKLLKGDAIQYVESILIKKDEVEAYHNNYVQQGYEGIMLRDPVGKYEHKRSYVLQKYKHFIDDEFSIVDFEKADMQDTLGALWCVDSKGSRFKAGLKMSHERRLEIWNNKEDYVGKKATVRYQELTGKEQVPRFGVTVAIRDYE